MYRKGGSITKSITISATNIIIPPGQACQNPGPAADDYNWVLLFQNCQKAGSYGSNSCNWSGGICNSNNVNKTGKYEEYSGPSNDITYCSTGYVCRYTAPAPTLNLTASPVSPITAGSSGTSNIQVVSSNFATGIDIDTFSNNTGATLGYPLSVSRNGTTSFYSFYSTTYSKMEL